MIDFVFQLKARNESLFYFGLICFVLSIIFLVFTRWSNVQVYGVNAWNKPLKFALSIGLYAWTMAWYCHYLPHFRVDFFNWAIIILLGFELVYIAIQAARGQTSHYNLSTPLYGALFAAMAFAASLVTIYTAYIGLLFFANSFPALPDYYVWAIRMSIIIFVVFSFQGFMMGSRLSHSVGALNDNSNIWVMGWSRTVGDLRVAHFIGMHALQVLPVLSFYLLKNTKLTFAVFILYGLLALFTLVQALQRKPLFPEKKMAKESIH